MRGLLVAALLAALVGASLAVQSLDDSQELRTRKSTRARAAATAQAAKAWSSRGKKARKNAVKAVDAARKAKAAKKKEIQKKGEKKRKKVLKRVARGGSALNVKVKPCKKSAIPHAGDRANYCANDRLFMIKTCKTYPNKKQCRIATNNHNCECPKGIGNKKIKKGMHKVKGGKPAKDYSKKAKIFPKKKPFPKLLKSNHECKSKDVNLGKTANAKQCGAKARKKGGKYFVFGKGRKKGGCYLEKTKSAKCPEGWEKDLYDFYSVKGGEEETALGEGKGHGPAGAKKAAHKPKPSGKGHESSNKGPRGGKHRKPKPSGKGHEASNKGPGAKHHQSAAHSAHNAKRYGKSKPTKFHKKHAKNVEKFNHHTKRVKELSKKAGVKYRHPRPQEEVEAAYAKFAMQERIEKRKHRFPPIKTREQAVKRAYEVMHKNKQTDYYKRNEKFTKKRAKKKAKKP